MNPLRLWREIWRVAAAPTRLVVQTRTATHPFARPQSNPRDQGLPCPGQLVEMIFEKTFSHPNCACLKKKKLLKNYTLQSRLFSRPVAGVAANRLPLRNHAKPVPVVLCLAVPGHGQILGGISLSPACQRPSFTGQMHGIHRYIAALNPPQRPWPLSTGHGLCWRVTVPPPFSHCHCHWPP